VDAAALGAIFLKPCSDLSNKKTTERIMKRGALKVLFVASEAYPL